jgi:hypothetical protein
MTVALTNDYIGNRFLHNAVTKDDSATLSYAPTNVINTRVDAAPTFTTPFYVPYLFSISGVVVDQANIAIGGYSPTFGYSVSFPDACNIYRAAGSDFQYASMIGVPALSYVTPTGVESRIDEDWTFRQLPVNINATGDPILVGSFIPFSGANVIIGDGRIYGLSLSNVGKLSLGENGLLSSIVSYGSNIGCTLNIGPLTNFSKQLTAWSTLEPLFVSGMLNYYTHDDSEIDIGTPTPFTLGSYHVDIVNLTVNLTSHYALTADNPFKLIGMDYTFSAPLVESTSMFLENQGATGELVRDARSTHEFFPNPPIFTAILSGSSSLSSFQVTKIHYICISDITVVPFPS